MLAWLIFTTLLAVSYGAEICCPNNGCFSDSPPFGHLPLPSCENVIRPVYLVYTRSNRNSPQTMTRTSVPGVFSNSRKTFFLIHGYTNDEDTEWLGQMKNALLNQGNYNVVVVGWGGGSQTLWYPLAASNTRVVGAETSAVAQNLLNRGVSRSNLVCVGHSLGGHTCGHAGKRTRWGRITGLDPAGPMFENYANSARLNSGDGNLVDVIHTMGREGFIMDFGTMVPLGHIDFYPSGGGIQPGCINYMDEDGQTGSSDENKGEGIVGCSHSRAVRYYQESVSNSCYYARQRCTNERDIPNSCSNCGGVCQSMGFNADRYSGRGLFYMEVNARSPHCQY